MKAHVLLAFEVERLNHVKAFLLKKANNYKDEYDQLWEASQTTLQDYYKLLETVSTYETTITTITEEHTHLRASYDVLLQDHSCCEGYLMELTELRKKQNGAVDHGPLKD